MFLKQYKSPSILVPWYEGYKTYQNELKRRITGNDQLRERTYEFIDFFERDRAFIQVFGFIEGGKDLKVYLEEGTMTPKERYTFASLLLYTLKLFHDAGIVHTDLKPDNVYLMPSDARVGFNLKLIDFDFTVLEGKTPPWDKSLVGEDKGMNYCGTPRYMSPEHLANKTPEKRSDVFTAALILYELLAQGHPYPEDENEYAEAAKAGDPPKPRFVVAPTPETETLGALMMNALSPRAEDRPFIGDLHQAVLKARNSFLGGLKTPTPPPAPPVPPHPAPAGKTKPVGSGRAGTEPVTGPVKTSVPTTGILPRQLGLSMEGSDDVDWFKTTSSFGRHSLVTATASILKYLPECQFTLRRSPGDKWFAVPPEEQPRNMTLVNGTELTSPVELAEGDTICLGSRKDTSRRNLFPMKVRFKESTRES